MTPEEKKQKQQIKILILLGIAFVVAMIYQFGLKKFMRARKENKIEVENLSADIKDADSKIESMEIFKQRNTETIQDIIQLSDKYVLKSRLGNYLLSAKEIIEDIAARTGVRVISVTETGLDPDPPKKRPKTRAELKKEGKEDAEPEPPSADPCFKGYRARVELNCGLHDFVTFLAELERSNPYACVHEIQIFRNPKTPPDKHDIYIGVQWPVWISDEKVSELRKKLD